MTLTEQFARFVAGTTYADVPQAARDKALYFRNEVASNREIADRMEQRAAQLEADADAMEAAVAALGGEVEPYKPFYERGPMTRPVDEQGRIKTAPTPA